MNKVIGSIVLMLFLGINVCFAQGPDDSITITTYYPSPHGVYRTLRLYPNDGIDPAVACTKPGEMYYDLSDNQVYVCDGSSGQWQPLGGGAGGYWAVSPWDSDNIYNCLSQRRIKA